MIIQGKFVKSDKIIKTQVQIDNGIISNIGDNLGKPDIVFYDELIFPGMGDIHVHAREDESGKQNYKEDYESVEKAAINGGVVHISVMPNTPSPLTTNAQLRWHQEKTKNSKTTIINYAGIGPDTKPLNSNLPYKVYTGPSVGPLFFKNELELRASLKQYKDLTVSFHVEDFDVLEANKNKPTHSERRPVECVETALIYVIKIIEEFNLKAKLCHWPIGGKSIEMIKEHRKRGFHTTLEVSPLHLYFDSDMLKEKPELWPYLQMNPALQSKEHRLQLIRALREGFIDFIATDHAPHTLDEKFKNFGGEEEYKSILKDNLEKCQKLSCQDGTSGTPQLDTFALITTWLMKAHNFSPQNIARVACENPGNFVNQFTDKKFGKVEIGYQGSFTVLDTNNSTLIKRKNLKTKAGWSPFEGITFPGKLVSTIINGEIQ